MSYQEYIDILRERPHKANELSERLHYSLHSVRNTMDEMTRMGIVVKERPSKEVTYSLTDQFKRDIPRIKSYNSNIEARVFIGLDSLLSTHNKKTAGINALMFLPELASKLLVIGLKAQKAYEIMDEKEQKKLSRELKALKLEFNTHYSKLLNSYQIMLQLKNTEEFWELEGLRKHFDPQTDNNNIPIPPIDATQALTIYQQLLD